MAAHLLNTWPAAIVVALTFAGAAHSAHAQQSARPERRVTVWVKLADDPVAVVRSRAPGRRLLPDAERTLVAALRARQDALIPSIAANGGTVLSTAQFTMNALKVSVPANRIEAIRRLTGVVGVVPATVSKTDATRPSSSRD